MKNNKTHILVVDDDNRIRDLLKEYLSENQNLTPDLNGTSTTKEATNTILSKLELIFQENNL